MKIRLLCLIFFFLFIGMLPTSVRAEMFTAYLNGAQEVPSVATSGTGYARVLLNESAGTISFTVVFNNLSSAQNASHIHTGAIGVSGPVTINFGATGTTSGTISGSTSITPAQIVLLRSHQMYVNVHSGNFGAGEIRGQLGAARPVDNDGDGRTDPSILRFPNIAPPGVSPITWWNRNSTSGVQIADWGNANTDFPAPGDYDGDGRSDIAIYRQGATTGAQSEYWIIQSSDSTVRYSAWGIRGDLTVQRDYDGDGRTDVAIFRRGAAAGNPINWYILRSSTGTVDLVSWGTTGVGTTSGDTPVPGDYDGDGKFDIAVYRFGGLVPNNSFLVRRSSDGASHYQQFGNFNTDWVIPGDYDGDGKYDFAVGRTGATGTSPLVWWILQSSNGVTRVQTFGRSSDTPAQGDYDGDARTDIAVYRPGVTTTASSAYWVLRSFDLSSEAITWGIGQDFSVNTFDAR